MAEQPHPPIESNIPVRKEINVIILGDRDVGKTSLVINLLQNTDTNRIHLGDGIFARIFDTPALKETEEERRRQLQQLAQHTRGRCHLVLYCISVDPASPTNRDSVPMTMRLLQEAYGKIIWKRCIPVLTKSNKAWKHFSELHDDPAEDQKRLKKHLIKYATFFFEELRKVRPAHDIVAFTAGWSPNNPDMPNDWRGELLGELLHTYNAGWPITVMFDWLEIWRAVTIAPIKIHTALNIFVMVVIFGAWTILQLVGSLKVTLATLVVFAVVVAWARGGLFSTVQTLQACFEGLFLYLIIGSESFVFALLGSRMGSVAGRMLSEISSKLASAVGGFNTLKWV